MAKISIVVPVHNEAPGLANFYSQLTKAVDQLKAQGHSHQIIFCNDGSTDDTTTVLQTLVKEDKHLSVISLSRNFGKEAALTAGIAQADGDATVILDGDGQHPIELIPDFVEAWKNGAKVVIGVRRNSASDGHFKRLGSRLFYRLFNRLSNQKLVPGSTDFRLIDASVQKAFLRLGESERITRGLIDWLGFEREYIYFDARNRESGTAQYNSSKLFKLASDSIVSLSALPLYISAGLGLLITPLALILGLTVLIEQIILEDPLNWNFTGTAMLGIVILFLVGIILICLGILSLYISHIHTQSQKRPLYIVDEDNSLRIDIQKTL